MRCMRPYFPDIRYAQDYKHPPFVVLITRALVFVSHVFDKILGNLKFVYQKRNVVVCGTCYLRPAIRLPSFLCAQCMVNIPISSH